MTLKLDQSASTEADVRISTRDGREGESRKSTTPAGLAAQARQIISDLKQLPRLPHVRIDLMYRETAGNHPFYRHLVREHYDKFRRRRPRFPLIRTFTLGVALAPLPSSFDEYFMSIEASARRNVKKAKRLGYRFTLINFNNYLTDIGEIRRSTDTRQGPMPADFLKAEVKPCTDPPSTTLTHGWPYFGVLNGEKLLAYAGCCISGEIAMIEHIYGHSAYHSDGIVPMLIAGIAQHLIETRPNVRYFCYSSYFGAGITMRRFKRKFRFEPYRVTWQLG